MSPFPRTHKGHTQMEYPFMYVPVCTIHLACTAQPSGAHRNEVHVYFGMCMVVEYRASENVTPGLELYEPQSKCRS